MHFTCQTKYKKLDDKDSLGRRGDVLPVFSNNLLKKFRYSGLFLVKKPEMAQLGKI